VEASGFVAVQVFDFGLEAVDFAGHPLLFVGVVVAGARLWWW
jgi:hypothetical protein